MSIHSGPTPNKARIARTILTASVIAAIAATGGISVADSATAAPASSPNATAPATQSSPAASVGTVEHTNTFFFDPSNGMNVSFTYLHQHVVSAGQPWGGVYSGPSNKSAPVNVLAGDHDSAPPAQWFTGDLANRWGLHPDVIQTNEGSGHTTTSDPSNLYFAINGDLTINGTSYNVVIGESKDGVPNSWWIGGTVREVNTGSWTMTDTAYNGPGLVTPDGKYVIDAATSNAHTFNIVPNTTQG